MPGQGTPVICTLAHQVRALALRMLRTPADFTAVKSAQVTREQEDSSALSFLYGPILTSIHDYWKNHSLD